MHGWMSAEVSDGWTVGGKKRGIGKWGGLSGLGLMFAAWWKDGLTGWTDARIDRKQGCEGEIRGRPNCLWPGCKHSTTKVAAETEGGISGKESSGVWQQGCVLVFNAPQLCEPEQTSGLQREEGTRTWAATLRRDRCISGAREDWSRITEQEWD